jgi:hypothetical protein
MPQGERQREVIEKRLKKLTLEPSQLQILDEFRRLEPCRKSNPQQVAERLNYYFESCQNFEIFPSIESMALALGVSRQTVLSWSGDNSEVGRMIRQAKELVSAALVQGSSSGGIPFVFGIFQLKANFGYSDKTDAPEVLTNEQKDAAAIEDKVNQSGLVWDETIGDFVIDGGGAGD